MEEKVYKARTMRTVHIEGLGRKYIVIKVRGRLRGSGKLVEGSVHGRECGQEYQFLQKSYHEKVKETTGFWILKSYCGLLREELYRYFRG